MCKRNCIYRKENGECNYAGAHYNDRIQTRHGAIARQLGVKPTDPEVRRRLPGPYCTLYLWDGNGRRSKTLEPEEPARAGEEGEAPKKQRKHYYKAPAPEDKLMEQYLLGKNDRQVGEALGIRTYRVGEWRRSNGLPSNFQPQKMYFDEELATKLYQQKKSDAEIAEALGVHKQRVYAWRDANGLPATKKGRLRQGALRQRREMYDAGMSDEQIAKAQCVKPDAIQAWRKRYKLPSNDDKRRRPRP